MGGTQFGAAAHPRVFSVGWELLLMSLSLWLFPLFEFFVFFWRFVPLFAVLETELRGTLPELNCIGGPFPF